jgi:hypothetical protein
MSKKEFKCEMCGGVFEKGWSDADAIEEAVNNGVAEEPCGVVCDDCFKKTPWYKPDPIRAAAEKVLKNIPCIELDQEDKEYEPFIQMVSETIRDAVRRERERCANIAEEGQRDDNCPDIAFMIRQGGE